MCIRDRIQSCDLRIAAHAKADVRSVRVQKLIGVGPLTADALVATIGDGREFSHGRQLSAWLGLTPTQHSSGGKARLGEISCRGDGYVGPLVGQGARSSLQRAKAVKQDQASAEPVSYTHLDVYKRQRVTCALPPMQRLTCVACACRS